MNISEELLENWCSQKMWECTKIPESAKEAERTPDYLIKINGMVVYAEVKEIVANKEEIKVLGQLEERGWGDAYGGEPGKTVREKIKDSYGQLKRVAERDKTSAILVLYNNSGIAGLGRLSHYDVLTAMFGLQTAPIKVPCGSAIPLSVGPDFFGSKKTVTSNRNRYLSGILTLYEHDQNGLMAFFYHNPYAHFPIDCRLIGSGSCVQYRVSSSKINWELIKCAEVESSVRSGEAGLADDQSQCS